MNQVITELEIFGLRISGQTTWIFLRLATADGLVGTGEATLNRQDEAVVAAARTHGHLVLGTDIENTADLADRLPYAELPLAAFSSAVMQALSDMRAREQGIRLADALGRVRRREIPTYANINRRTRERSPAGFRQSASDAIAAGHSAIKIAPFDDIAPGMDPTVRDAAFDAAIRRIEATRACIGPQVRLMVDCHWRFDEAMAFRAIDAVAASGLYWLECPVAETADNLPLLQRLRSKCNAAGMRLTGCEKAIRSAGFMPFLEAGAYDVMMPDVKYAGGPAEMLRIAETFAEYGVEFSPHNPTGPICHAASLQLCAVVENLDALELQFDETPTFDRLVGRELPPVTEGRATLPTPQPGIGVALDDNLVRTLPKTAQWQAVNAK